MAISSGLSSSALLPAGLGFRNKIINGAMAISQRGTSAISNGAGTNTYGTDRWHAYGESASKMTITQSTTNPTGQGFTNSTLITSSAATTPSNSHYYGVRQIIEGSNMADLAWGTSGAKPIVVSFWVRSSIAGTYSFALFNSGNNRALISTYTISAVDTWEKKTIYINSGDITGTWATDSSAGLSVWFDLGSGSNAFGTANTWNASLLTRTSGSVDWIGTSGATFYLTGVQLEQNYQPTPFEQRPYGVELALCQRYWEQSYAYGTAAGTATYDGAFTESDSGNASGNHFHTIRFVVPKRNNTYTVSAYRASDGLASYWVVYSSPQPSGYALGPQAYRRTVYSMTVYVSDGGYSWIVGITEGHWTVNAEL